MGREARIKISDNSIDIQLPDKKLTLNRISLPENFLQWQSAARLKLFDILKEHGTETVKMQPAHLPVVATLGDGPFSINLASRGIGPLPKNEILEKFTKLFNKTRSEIGNHGWQETLSHRMKAAKQFYKDPKNFDTSMLGGLEIFEGKTAHNLAHYPLASILYTGEAPSFHSYQLNGVVTFINEKDPYYRFLLAARELFAFDTFHVRQVRYPYGYLFHIVELVDKTPYPRKYRKGFE